MPKLTRKKAKGKKPHPDFPLFRHSRGHWAKKVRGKTHYFGKVVDDLDGQKALAKWLDDKDALLAGRTPRAGRDGLELGDLCNAFATSKRLQMEAGELTDRSYALLYATCARLVDAFGRDRLVDDLVADDFERLRSSIAKAWGPVALGNEIQRVRGVFKYGYEAGLIDKAVRFGPGFKKPSAKTMRVNRAKRGLRMFEREELLAVLDSATVNLKAMLLLACNAALGNTEIALLPIKAVNLKTGWLTYPREKTGVPRRVPLWPETVEAIREAIQHRHNPTDEADAKLLFIGPRGENYIGGHRGWRVHQELARVLVKAKVTRKGLSFYCVRHGFQTVAEGAKDLSAVQSIMGHAPRADDMSAAYRERVDDDRLRAVVDHVRKWVWPVAEKTKEK